MVVLAASTGAAAAPSPAGAAACSPPAGYIEGWDGTNTCTTFLWSYWQYYLSAGECHNVVADRTSYVWNNSSTMFYAYTGSGCTGAVGPLYAYNAGAMTGSWNNNIASIRRSS